MDTTAYNLVSRLLRAGCDKYTFNWVDSWELKKSGAEWPPELMWLCPYFDNFNQQLRDDIKQFCEDNHE